MFIDFDCAPAGGQVTLANFCKAMERSVSVVQSAPAKRILSHVSLSPVSFLANGEVHLVHVVCLRSGIKLVKQSILPSVHEK